MSIIEKPDDQLGFLLMQVLLLKQRFTNSVLRIYDITYIQFVILAGILELGESGKLVTQQTISLERLLDKAMVSNVVKTLIAKNLITRDTHPSDNRAYTLGLTAEGQKLVVKCKTEAKKIDKMFFSSIDEDHFRETLKTLQTNNTN